MNAGLPDRARLGTWRKTLIRLILAFVLMLGLALALMVQFTDGTSVPADVTPQATDGPGALTIPVEGVVATQLFDSWRDARDDGARAHEGTDIMAPAGTPVLAAADGTVEKLFDSAAGGHTVYIRSPDRRWSYYYAHLAGYAPGLTEGQRVRAGQRIAFVGDTGNAGPGNYHLHFGISRMAPDDGWWEGEAVDPYPLLVGNRPGR